MPKQKPLPSARPVARRRPNRTVPRPRAPKYFLRSVDNPGNGQKMAEVVLGMAAPLSTNSDTSGATTVERHRNALNAHHTNPSYTFVIGHLINEQFSCMQNDGNFVPLTSAANSEHKTAIESPIAAFLQATQGAGQERFTRSLNAAGTRFFGLHYRVTSSEGKWGDNVPDIYVPDSIHWEVELAIFEKDGQKSKNVLPADIALLNSLGEFARNYIRNIAKHNAKWTVDGTIYNRKQSSPVVA